MFIIMLSLWRKKNNCKNVHGYALFMKKATHKMYNNYRVYMFSVLWWCSSFPYPRSKISSGYLLYKGKLQDYDVQGYRGQRGVVNLVSSWQPAGNPEVMGSIPTVGVFFRSPPKTSSTGSTQETDSRAF